MMNGTKKSDSSIVPAKPANKVERSTAELVEGDDETKRNAELQSTVRTQSREAVSQAQARIRGAVTRNEREKLTALLHHVSIDVLRWAFFNIKKQAAPRVSERMCKQVSVSLPYRGDSHDEQLYDYTGIAGSTSC